MTTELQDLNEAGTLTAADCYDSSRLPHYGDIEYGNTIERCHLGEAAMAAYTAACERWLATEDEDGYIEDDTRVDFSVTLTVTMEVTESCEQDVPVGETYSRDDFTAYPGELYWSGCPQAVEDCRR